MLSNVPSVWKDRLKTTRCFWSESIFFLPLTLQSLLSYSTCDMQSQRANNSTISQQKITGLLCLTNIANSFRTTATDGKARLRFYLRDAKERLLDDASVFVTRFRVPAWERTFWSTERILGQVPLRD